MSFECCDRGVCAANLGHAGTCVEASGWDEDYGPTVVVMRSYSDHVRQWGELKLRPLPYSRWVHYVLEGAM